MALHLFRCHAEAGAPLWHIRFRTRRNVSSIAIGITGSARRRRRGRSRTVFVDGVWEIHVVNKLLSHTHTWMHPNHDGHRNYTHFGIKMYTANYLYFILSLQCTHYIHTLCRWTWIQFHRLTYSINFEQRRTPFSFSQQRQLFEC